MTMADKKDVSPSRLEQESKVLAAAVKQSVDKQDKGGIELAIRELSRLIQAGQNFWRKASSVKVTEELAQPLQLELPPCATINEEGAVYQVLGVGRLSCRQEIHVRFLRLIRDLLQNSFNPGPGNRASREQLRQLCIAHDVLHDPITRTDYDFRTLGLRGDNQSLLPEGVTTSSNRPALRIGELLQCAEILEPAELDIAVDMHKAEPEMMFGQFLVKSGYLALEELDSALLGQRLILAGKLSVAQFKIAMKAVHQQAIPMTVTLQQNNWISEAELTEFLRPPEVLPEAERQATEYVEPEVVEQAHCPNVEQKLNVQNAVPSWANQLVWDDEPLTLPDAVTKHSEPESEST